MSGETIREERALVDSSILYLAISIYGQSSTKKTRQCYVQTINPSVQIEKQLE